MIDWTKSMKQTFEFWEIDPGTWKKKRRLTEILSSKISRDSSAATLETASIEGTEFLGECYVRIIMIVLQNGITYDIPLGTFLIQSPSSNFDGKINKISMDAYSPLLELRDGKPPLGFTLLKDSNIMSNVCALTNDNCRAPVAIITGDRDKFTSNFTADPDESWLDYISAMLKGTNYDLALDEIGRVIFVPYQTTESMQPRWTFTDDNSSILLPSVSYDNDIYGIPNVVEVVYSDTDGSGESLFYYSKVVNDDPNSPTSTVARGREIIYRDTTPSINGTPSQEVVDHYAVQLLEDLSSVTHSVKYTHGYCPVRVGDCVRLNYVRAGLTNIKAKVTSQEIDCKSGCSVSETAVYTTKLWKGE